MSTEPEVSEGTWRRPLTSTSVREEPRPRRSGVIWLPPREVTPAELKLLELRKLGNCANTSPRLVEPRCSISAVPTVVTGVGATNPVLNLEPVTIIASSSLAAGSASCAKAEEIDAIEPNISAANRSALGPPAAVSRSVLIMWIRPQVFFVATPHDCSIARCVKIAANEKIFQATILKA